MARNKYPEETVKLILDKACKLFVEKGYEGTSIQDILNNLGGLSKGAIYHHFKSKEEIFEAVCQKIDTECKVFYDALRDNAIMNGLEKLKAMIKSGYANPCSDVLTVVNTIMHDPKFVSAQVYEMYEVVVPLYVEPIIRQGMEDGSIKTDYPKELAGVMITLMNIWVNPIFSNATPEELGRKIEFLGVLLRNIGVDLIDEETVSQYVAYGKFCNQQKMTARK